jgi:hypothetical protein
MSGRFDNYRKSIENTVQESKPSSRLPVEMSLHLCFCPYDRTFSVQRYFQIRPVAQIHVNYFSSAFTFKKLSYFSAKIITCKRLETKCLGKYFDQSEIRTLRMEDTT